VRILVTGGAGFIGSNLCDRLIAEGHEVTAVDNLITGHAENIEHLLLHERFHWRQMDIVESLPVGEWEAVFHLASPASPVGYSEHPIETMLVNSVGTHHALDAARANGARFLLASTSEVYGDPLEHPQTETYWGNVNPVGPRACYDEGKRFAEALTVTYVRENQLDARIVRIFNTYGPRNHPEDGRIVPTFCMQALQGAPITVFGDGQQTRSLCYVGDLVEGLLRAQFTAGTTGDVFNLGRPDEHSVLEYATIIQRLAASSSPVVHLPAREEEIARRRPDIGKARRVLGWEPVTSLEKGLAETIAWFRQMPPPSGAAGLAEAVRPSEDAQPTR